MYCDLLPFLVKSDPSCLLWPGSTHLRDPRTTSNPSSPSSSPQTPSALGSGVSDPVLNGGLCSAAFCSSAGGKFSHSFSYDKGKRERVSERWPSSSSSSSNPPSKHRGPSGSHYGIVSRCHHAVVRNSGQASAVPPLRQLRLDVVKCSARVVLSQQLCEL